MKIAKDVWSIDEGDLSYEDEAMRAHAKKMIFPIGEPNDKFAQYFTGKSFLAPVSTSQVGIFNVTFEPGCRNNWHIHHAKSGGGQILICIAGRGYYQEEGKEAVEMKPGDCVNIPAEVKHWHGAAPDEWFSHLAIEVPGEETSSEWCETVTDEIYEKVYFYEARPYILRNNPNADSLNIPLILYGSGWVDEQYGFMTAQLLLLGLV